MTIQSSLASIILALEHQSTMFGPSCSYTILSFSLPLASKQLLQVSLGNLGWHYTNLQFFATHFFEIEGFNEALGRPHQYINKKLSH
jgi:hypothetical protein